MNAHHPGVLHASSHLPPTLPSPVDDAPTHNRNIVGIAGDHQGFHRRLTKFGFRQVICMIRRTKKSRAFIDFERDTAFESNRATYKGACAKFHRAPTLLRATINCRLDRMRIFCSPIGFCPEGAWITYLALPMSQGGTA